MKDYSIGIVGFGSYATSDFFRRVIDAFPAEKEWDRPRVVIDNYCTMPSRVRAILFNENVDILIRQMSEATETLLGANVDRIIYDCNTAHFFVPEVLERVPKADGKVLNIIDELGSYIHEKAQKMSWSPSAGLMASEGVIETKIYHNYFQKYGITIDAPGKEQYNELRNFIEAVKQDNINEDVLNRFAEFINDFKDDIVILGCTELPVLYDCLVKNGFAIQKTVLDPLQVALNILIEEYNEAPDVEWS